MSSMARPSGRWSSFRRVSARTVWIAAGTLLPWAYREYALAAIEIVIDDRRRTRYVHYSRRAVFLCSRFGCVSGIFTDLSDSPDHDDCPLRGGWPNRHHRSDHGRAHG